jgi:uncharacterized protein YbjT (DUF2867 family)
MARALIVGCGCRGRTLGERLLADGWAVRGTSRHRDGIAAIAAAGIEPAAADPARPGSVLELVGDVAVVVWLLGSASGGDDELEPAHGEPLEHLLSRLVDTPVRGFAYEGAGRVEPATLARGAAAVREAGRRWRIPVAVVESDPEDRAEWLKAMLAAARELTGGARDAI